MTRDENYVEHALQVGEGLAGLTLEQLGFEPRPEDLTDDQRSYLDADELEWANSITPERRDRACSRQSSWPAPYGRPPPS
ncbi:MAG: hypothetical protein NVSMB43_18830 [Pseudarthrobacter sp.]